MPFEFIDQAVLTLQPTTTPIAVAEPVAFAPAAATSSELQLDAQEISNPEQELTFDDMSAFYPASDASISTFTLIDGPEPLGNDENEIVVTGDRYDEPDDGSEWGPGTGGSTTGGGNSGGTGAGGGLPAGFEPYGDGEKYMVGEDGKLYLTPEYLMRIDAGEVDWWGVANDIAFISASSLAVVLTAPFSFAAGALALGLEALDEMNAP